MSNYQIMTGNEACARAAILVGMRFFAGYPITPATEVAEISSELLPQVDGVYMQMEDELGSIGAVIGASATGKKAMTATSGPGFSLMQENLGWAYQNEIPMVIVDVMRQGPSGGSSTLAAQGDIMQAKWGTHGDHPMLVLTPNSVQEVFDETIRAFNLAEKYRQPVILLYDAIIAHMSEKILVREKDEIEIYDRLKPTCDKKDYKAFNYRDASIQPMASFGEGYHVLYSGLTHDETGFPTATANHELLTSSLRHLTSKLADNSNDIKKYENYLCDDADIIVVSLGIVSRSAKAAVEKARQLGIKAGLFRPITMWPFPHKDFSELNLRAQVVITTEMNAGQLNQVVIEDIDRGQLLFTRNSYNGVPIKDEDILQTIKEANSHVK